MAIKSDNPLDQEIVKMKTIIERLKKDQTVFTNTFKILPPKDRAKMFQQIMNDHRTLKTFIEKSKRGDIVNSGTKFSLENLKNSFEALLHLWRKTEILLQGGDD